MNIARFLLVCVIGCILVVDSGCRRSAYKMWGYSLTNYGGETFLNANVFRGSGSHLLGPGALVFVGTGYVGVFGQMPRAVTIAFASKDKRQHRIYVLVPRRPRGYGSKSPEIYFVVEGRCKAIATWQDPGLWPKLYLMVRNTGGASAVTITQWFNYSSGPGGRVWCLSPAGVPAGGKTSLLEPNARDEYVRVDVTSVHAGRWFRISEDVPQHVEVDYTWHGRVHNVPVTLPLPRLVMRPWPRIYFTINRHGQLAVRRKFEGPERWFCAIGDNGKQAFSNLTVTGHGKSYALGGIGPKSDASLSALGHMPKALDVGFVSNGGQRHQVHITVPPGPAGRGGQSPELYLVISNTGKVMATYTCPAEFVGVVWSYGIGTHLNERFTNVVVTYKGSVNAPWRLDAIAPGGANAAPPVIGPMPKAVEVSFTSPDGQRHKVHVILPPPKVAQGRGLPEVDLEIEKGGKVTAGWWQ